jgi:putative FmdB family regulatory protein
MGKTTTWNLDRAAIRFRGSMPIYEYACKKCGKVVEVFQKVNDPGPKTCEKCGGKLGRVISHTSFQLKGGGWYKDLYSSTKPESGGSGGSEGEGPKSESKTETKAEGAKPEAKAESKTDAKPAKVESKKPAKEKKAAKAI